MFDESPREECGIFGITSSSSAAYLTYLGLYSLQHRGQESCGIVVSDTKRLVRHAAMGLVNQVFNEKILEHLEGVHAIGHNRYSTTGSSTLANSQPFLIDFKAGQIAGAHNGNLVNAMQLRREMERDGSIFTTTTDTEVVMHLIARSKHDTIDAMILDALSRVKGAYSMLFLTRDALYGARDPLGFRPLILGKLGQSYIFSSETCALDLIRAEFVRELNPGELLRISRNQLKSFSIPLFDTDRRKAQCVFEFIYFSRPDSFVFGENVDKVRRNLGRRLAREHPADAEMVIGVPDSATTAAIGYAEESGIPFNIGLIRNHYIGRTFIDPKQKGRDMGVRIKFNTVKGVLKGKKIVVVDDSIVRGTTMKKIVELIRTASPKEIHLRISSPPVICPCFYGIDMPTKKELIASEKDVAQIRNFLNVDSLGYLSIDGMLSVMPGAKEDYCRACFSGNYPISTVNNSEY